MTAPASVLKRFARDRSGLAAIELAIIAPVLFLCTLCVADLGRYALDKTWVTGAASAGAEYAAAHADDPSYAPTYPMGSAFSAAIATAATSATPTTNISVSLTPSSYYGCATSTGVTASTQGATCPSGTSTGGLGRRICLGDGDDAVHRFVQRRGHLLSVDHHFDSRGAHTMIRRTFVHDRSGGAAIEFALTSPIYFFGLFGLVQVGLWLFADFSLQRAVDAASRCAALGTCTDAKASAVSATVGLPVSSSAFTVTSKSCGSQVAANYTVPTFIPVLPNISVNVSACYPK